MSQPLDLKSVELWLEAALNFTRLCRGLKEYLATVAAQAQAQQQTNTSAKPPTAPPPPRQDATAASPHPSDASARTSDDKRSSVVVDAPLNAKTAAELLGVTMTSTADQVRAAFRRKMRDGRLHPDQGGNPEVAKRYVAAKNLLTQRLKVQS